MKLQKNKILFIVSILVLIILSIVIFIAKKLNRNKILEKHMYITYEKMQKLFKKFNIEYVASGGTLIGVARDSKFIPWDSDMDFCTDYKNKDIIFSKEFKQEAIRMNLEIRYFEKAHFWNGIGGLKISDQGGYTKGQIDMFFFSNAVNENIYYLGNDGHKHMWAEHCYMKENLFPIRFLNFEFPTISKTVQIPCPNKYDKELKRHFGEKYMEPPSDKQIVYKIDKFNLSIIYFFIFLNFILLFIV